MCKYESMDEKLSRCINRRQFSCGKATNSSAPGHFKVRGQIKLILEAFSEITKKYYISLK